ncbi:hypothetical protein Tco_0618225 [Tanacetum coccineum]
MVSEPLTPFIRLLGATGCSCLLQYGSGVRDTEEGIGARIDGSSCILSIVRSTSKEWLGMDMLGNNKLISPRFYVRNIADTKSNRGNEILTGGKLKRRFCVLVLIPETTFVGVESRVLVFLSYVWESWFLSLPCKRNAMVS